MSFLLKLALLAVALTLPLAGYVFYNATLSADDWIYQGNGQWRDGGIHAAPGPLVGAGLPGVVVVGAAYLALRRTRRKAK